MKFLITSVEGNRQKLDGGSMFGNVPRAMWEGWIPPDERHRIPLACRAFLVRDIESHRMILLEAGIGAFFEPRLADRFGVEDSGHQLLANLAEMGVEPSDIDVVILSHLHFDHAGGLLTPWSPDGRHELVFPNAGFIAGREAWQRARSPHARDKASFVPALLDLLEASGRLELVHGESTGTLGSAFSFSLSHGHTPGMLLIRLDGGEGQAVFCGDLIPGRPWVHLPVTMGYDRFPELLIDEKKALLDRCMADGTRLLFTHDPDCAMASVHQDGRGRYGTRDEMPVLRDFPL